MLISPLLIYLTFDSLGLDSRTHLNLGTAKNGDLAHASLNFVSNVNTASLLRLFK